MPLQFKDYILTNILFTIPSSTKLAEKDLESYDDYNPFEHREIDKPNSTMGSLAHLLKSSLGTGILAMPAAFKNAGLLFGALGTIIVGLICTHCVHILVSTHMNKINIFISRSCMDRLGKRMSCESILLHLLTFFNIYLL